MPPIAKDVRARIGALGAALPRLDVDIAAFQEIWDADARGEVIAAGRRAGLVHAWHNPAAFSGGGLLVLARSPILAADFEAYELAGFPEALQHADYWGGKGVAQLTFDSVAGPFCLLNTHLHAAYSARRGDPYVGHRVGQVLQLVERVRGLALPIIAAGDFNFEETFEEHAIFTGATGAIDVAVALHARENTILRSNPYRRGSAADERIDYLFCRSGERASVTPLQIERVLAGPIAIDGHAASYSDHAGLLAEFEIRERSATLPVLDRAELLPARRLLERGHADAERRRSEQRRAAALGLAVAPVAVWGARRAASTRRVFLGRALLAAGTAAGLSGAASLIRSESFRTDELRGFEAAFERLDRLLRP
jgi:endonuclease/exonuclease/phosphatase family metal-dependent hydrolase